MSIIKAPDNFYPTPKALIDKMLEDFSWNGIKNILEPSAGTGNIVKELLKENGYYRTVEIDCIEYDPEIRTILKYNFSHDKYHTINDRIVELRAKERAYEDYVYAVKRLKEGGLSEWGERDMRARAEKPVSPLTEAELTEQKLLEKELDALKHYNNVKVIFNDFLNFHTYKQYDLIIMNPPFDKGDLHLLHALDLQKDGGKVICLLNAETIKNPYNNSRQLLKQKLEEYEANIEFLTGAFSTSETERKTNVEVALVKVNIPAKQKKSFIIEGLRKAKEEAEQQGYEATELITSGNWIKEMVEQFNFELAAIKGLIEEYKAVVPYMLKTFDEKYQYPVVELTINDRKLDYSKNDYVKVVRRKYWNNFFNKPEFQNLLTSELRKKYDTIVESMENYDFTEYNVYTVMEDLTKNLTGSLEDTILDLFETLTAKYSWFSDGDKNIHYYNGWKSNKAWIINKKVIIPMNGAFSYDWFYKKYNFDLRRVYSVLSDIEKTLNYLDGGKNEKMTDLYGILKVACESGISRKIACKYFNITVYKKGTCHIEFTDLDLLMKLNLYGSQKKGWLPPCYGKKAYKDMTAEEKEVIDEFQGEEAYNEVMAKSDYYLAPVTNSVLMLGE